jgi:pectate lyase
MITTLLKKTFRKSLKLIIYLGLSICFLKGYGIKSEERLIKNHKFSFFSDFNLTQNRFHPHIDTLRKNKQKAFPNAFGAGAFASGGRDKPVYIVKNLNDSGKGSFRWAISAARSSNGGTIIFEVSGIILLKSWLKIDVNNLTIAGQSAPKGGITLSGTKIKVQDVNNLIIRNLRIRPIYGEYDALELINVQNAILDHLSISWGGDETISLKGKCYNITFQRLLISEGKTGSLFGDSNDPSLSENLSFLNSLFFNISHRTPNVNSNGRVDIINNVIHNWQYRLTKVKGSVRLNHINNYYSIGQNTKLSSRVNSAISSYNPKIYTSGNFINHGILENKKADNWFLWKEFKSGGFKEQLSSNYKTLNGFDHLGPQYPLKSASEAYLDVLGDVGCNTYIDDDMSIVKSLDEIDLMYMGILNSVDGFNYLPYESTSKNETFTKGEGYLKFHENKSNSPIASRSATWDIDQDGIPDLWEKELELNERLNNNLRNDENYTNLELYLNRI